ncbi:MAG: hypothetical protein H8F28_26345 [Fibrella sp.]|nr:hypothetical protein [Armatimonadota bacterium]
MTSPEATRWSIDATTGGIVWNVADAENPANILPHADHVEMSGRRVSVIVRYRIDAQRRLFVERDIFFPQLRVRDNDVRGYLRRVYDDRLILPRFRIGSDEWFPSRTPIDRVTLDGVLKFYYVPHKGVSVCRCIAPSPKRNGFVEDWQFTCDETTSKNITQMRRGFRDEDDGLGLTINIRVGGFGDLDASRMLQEVAAGTTKRWSMVFQADDIRDDQAIRELLTRKHIQESENLTAGLQEELAEAGPRRERERIAPEQAGEQVTERSDFARRIQSDSAHISFICPDPELNRLFSFAKLRAAESLFDTEIMGLVHSPGGGNFYCGIWANDQCEYANPFFAFLNDADANEASVNAYRHYAKHMKPDYAPVPTSFEMGGTMPYHAGGDRGDAAMIASGLSRYLLVRGERDLAVELYPMLRWCNEYNRRKTDARGVILSDSDELEGRFSTGDANLSTATLAYDGYRMSAHVARELGHDTEAADWNARADALATAIEAHFGATVEGFVTYRYHDGNDVLRSWICLPLVFGLAEDSRKTGTLDALFSPRLWTPDGLATQAGETTFWDRSTLYGLRGAFIAGATESAYERLLTYSRRRLLGDHVPYPVEAYPENAQAHLSAESALYCRVFLEGLLGLHPTGFDSFTLTPRLPKAWNEYNIRFTAFGGRDISIQIMRKKGQVEVSVTVPDANGAYSYSGSGTEERTHTIRLQSVL